jgi:hypothetical protein
MDQYAYAHKSPDQAGSLVSAVQQNGVKAPVGHAVVSFPASSNQALLSINASNNLTCQTKF